MYRHCASNHELGQTVRKYISLFWASQAVGNTGEVRLCVEPRCLVTVSRQHIRVSLALPASRHYPLRATASSRFLLRAHACHDSWHQLRVYYATYTKHSWLSAHYWWWEYKKEGKERKKERTREQEAEQEARENKMKTEGEEREQ